MAYGVKYRLEFSDVLGYGKKVEILKKDYTGEILPMVGTGEPVVIKWNSKDDFYTPIIGSSCQLNLLVTESIQYDDFYKFDEKEYKVKVSFSKPIYKDFTDRIVKDLGIYESIDCVKSFTGEFYTISTFYENRVLSDGGKVESLNCVSENINDEKINIWEDYWQGFIVVDRQKEALVSHPYPISLNAFDGLGTLDKYNAPLSIDDFKDSGNEITDIQRISKILQNIDLNLDIVFINDLHYLNNDNSVSKFPNITTIPNYLFELKKGFNSFTAKEQLNNLLTIYNMRIFQSFSKWYIVENSNSFDQFVKEYIKNENEFFTPPTNIRDLITKRLESINNEFLNSERFNYLGILQDSEFVDTVKIAPKNLIPINNNLKREYLQPINKVERSFSTNQYEKSYWNNNAGFEYGNFNWNIVSNYAEIVENEITKQGSYSIKLKNLGPSIDAKCFSTNRILQPGGLFGNLTQDISSGAIAGTKFTFSYFVEASDILVNTYVKYVIKFYNDEYNNVAYWNDFTQTWQTSIVVNGIKIDQFNTWQTKTKQLKDASGSGVTNGKLDLEIWNTRTDTTSEYVTTYFDNVGLFQDGARFFDLIWIDGIQEEIAPSKSVSYLISSGKEFSSKKSYESILLPDNTPAFIDKWYRSRDYNFINNNITKYNSIVNISNQGVMNDFREFCTRYQGSFRCKDGTPLSLHNKIWFNWPGTLEDNQASILDGLVYSVKSNIYNIKAHVPNDDNDSNITRRVS